MRSCHIAPFLPDWLPALSRQGIAIGGAHMAIAIRRQGEDVVIDDLQGGGLEIVQDWPAAPLRGRPAAAAGWPEKT